MWNFLVPSGSKRPRPPSQQRRPLIGSVGRERPASGTAGLSTTPFSALRSVTVRTGPPSSWVSPEHGDLRTPRARNPRDGDGGRPVRWPVSAQTAAPHQGAFRSGTRPASPPSPDTWRGGYRAAARGLRLEAGGDLEFSALSSGPPEARLLPARGTAWSRDPSAAVRFPEAPHQAEACQRTGKHGGPTCWPQASRCP